MKTTSALFQTAPGTPDPRPRGGQASRPVGRWLRGLVLGVACAHGALAAAINFEVVSPRNDTPKNQVFFSAKISGITEMVVVRLDYAGVTHYLAARPPAPGGNASVNDPYLPFVLGPADLAWTVLSRDGRELLPKAARSLVIEKELRAGDDPFGLKNIRHYIITAAADLDQQYEGYLQAIQWADGHPEERNSKSVAGWANKYVSTRSYEFHNRLRNYSDIAGNYATHGRLGDALRAVAVADRIYESEKNDLAVGLHLDNFPKLYSPTSVAASPPHFEQTAILLARQGDTDKALTWIEKAIEFQLKQAAFPGLSPPSRQSCQTKLAGHYQSAAALVLLVKKDLSRYDEYIRRAHAAMQGQASR